MEHIFHFIISEFNKKLSIFWYFLFAHIKCLESSNWKNIFYILDPFRSNQNTRISRLTFHKFNWNSMYFDMIAYIICKLQKKQFTFFHIKNKCQTHWIEQISKNCFAVLNCWKRISNWALTQKTVSFTFYSDLPCKRLSTEIWWFCHVCHGKTRSWQICHGDKISLSGHRFATKTVCHELWVTNPKRRNSSKAQSILKAKRTSGRQEALQVVNAVPRRELQVLELHLTAIHRSRNTIASWNRWLCCYCILERFA